MTLPAAHKTVVLAIDVSGSMLAHDIQPSRIQAAQEAAKEFVNAQPPYTRIGVVAFAGTANLIQPPTSNRNRFYLLSTVWGFSRRPQSVVVY